MHFGKVQSIVTPKTIWKVPSNQLIMPRRKSKNRTNIRRLPGIPYFDAWVSFSCLKCSHRNYIKIGKKLLSPSEAYDNVLWKCEYCGYIHSKNTDLPVKGLGGKDLPFKSWGKETTSNLSIGAQRFWKSFFVTATESIDSYWKQCNTCGRILPFLAFSGHRGWGPLERQMECRACKSVINAKLNPKRTKEQLHESGIKRRFADLLLKGENENINFKELFRRFDGKCFKTGAVLNIKDRKSWAIDHILPSKYLYPLTKENAALLSREANENKRDRWPREFYSNQKLKELSNITGIKLTLISSKRPIVNKNIDVDRCVSRVLTVRNATDLSKRIKELKKLLRDHNLVGKLSQKNRKMLGL